MKGINIYSFCFLVFILLFTMYECEEIKGVTQFALYGESKGVHSVYYGFLLLLFGFCYYLFYPRPKDKLFRFFSFFIVSLLFISSLRQFSSRAILNLSLQICTSLFAFNYFYDASRKINKQLFYIGIVISVIFILYTIITTYQYQLLNSLTGESRAGSVYILLFLLPFFLLSDNRIVRIISISLVLIILFFSLKRGGVVSFAIALLVYLQVNTYIQKGQLRLKELFVVFFVGLPILFILAEFFHDYVNEVFYRLGNIKVDEGSGRTSVYEDTWNMIQNSDIQSLLLGHGWNMVKEKSITGFSAHNDFLELLYDSGIFVTGIYLIFVYIIYKRMFKLIQRRSPNAAPFSFSVITFTVNSMISHVVLYPFYFIPVAIVWGYILGKDNRDNKLIKIKK